MYSLALILDAAFTIPINSFTLEKLSHASRAHYRVGTMS